MNWQPIETAPKDGRVIIAFRPTNPPHIEGMYWDGQNWSWSYDADTPGSTPPTFWLPLPEPPKEAE